MASPLEQFTIEPIVKFQIGGTDLSFTNSSLWMMITALILIGFVVIGTQRRALVPGRLQSAVEYFYQVVADMVRDNVGSAGRPYFPFIFSLFMFILFGNLLGLIPGAFTFTSHLAVTFAMSAFIFIGVTIIGLITHGLKFFSLFFPHGAPIASAPVLIPIEIISYFSRPISLSVRLFANMLAGHTMMKVFAGLIIMMGSAGGLLKIVAVLPLLAVIGLTGLEFLVAALQAYVFSILTCMYLHDAIHLH